MNIIPIPSRAHLSAESTVFSVSPKVTIHFSEFSEKAVQTFLLRTGRVAIPCEHHKSDITLVHQNDYCEEEYDLSITRAGVTVKASSDRGVIHALTTLFQLMNQNGGIPCGQIHDRPKYAHRGLSLDCARTFFSVEEVKRILKQMSLVKMNVLHWHLTDDQAWRMESKRFPKLHQQHGKDYFTQDDIREVVGYAKTHGIEVVPEIELPGHVTALLAAYPEHSCSGYPVQLVNYGGIHPIILCAGKESTYQLISDLLDEICPLFPSGRFHIGGDEAPKEEWEKCPCCQQKMKEEKLKSETELQGYFSNRVMEMLRGKGKTAICWNESLDADHLNGDAVIQFWTVNGAERLRSFADKGGRFIYSDMFTYYFDYPYSMTPLRRLYEESLCIGDTDYSDHPAMLGAEVCMWAEHIRDAKGLEEKLFPRLYAAAEVMWSGPKSSCYEDFKKRLTAFLAAHHPVDMGLVKENGWNPEGEERRKEAFGHMASINNAMPPEHQVETAKRSAPTPLFQKKIHHKLF